MFLPCHNNDTAMDTAIMIWNKVMSHTGLFKNIISSRDPKFTSALWTNLHNLFGTKLLFSTAYHPKTNGLAERMIQTLEEIIMRFCAYGIEFKDSDAIIEKGWNTRLPYDPLKKALVDIHPTASSFKLMLDKARHHANRFMKQFFEYANERWDKSHKPLEFKIGDLVLVSTLNFNDIKGPKKLKDSFEGPFMIKALHGPNAVKPELTGELINKHQAFPGSLINVTDQVTRNYFH
ncbi:hypothetical protein O181_008509 [Austropuccinia psidii MF-1]|uniref:Integrase catalytic domain-containing protein n=1 Tax=Austropuccinia psidii MF-1 TaxID=1389203 RepID=A0A9Q3BMP4_9BASI|nr:hypothetical protein [Austropuccinia psidii MF-1]